MKLGKVLMLTSLALVLAACSVSTKSVNVAPVKPPAIVAPDSALLKACDRPVLLEHGPLTQAQVEELWITDRAALLACYRRHLALRNYIVDRDEALRGDK
ncbi:dehydrogenase [Rhizobium sp. NFR07]|uniref:dehydrogenase n=1 Tax=Rhizobium sp. NFR07 TaxID=1566262 RepID=UPI0015A63571|nr:dehydrogenase [Rhizobium sp. NFR07]